MAMLLLSSLGLSQVAKAQSNEAQGTLALMQAGEGTAGTATYFNAYFWVTFTDANGQKQNTLLSINSNPANYTAYLIGGVYGSTRVYYAITSFTWTRYTSFQGNVSFQLHNADAQITDIQVNSLAYFSQKPCTRCNVQTSLTSMSGTYEYVVD